MSRDYQRVIGSLLAAGFVGVLLVPLAAPAQAAETDLDAQMHSTMAFPNAHGQAEYESQSTARDFEITIAGVRALAGDRVVVRVHGEFVGGMTVGQFGRAHLARHSGVPSMTIGDVVGVRTAGGRLVTYGALHRDID
jgi:hypothetical protein